MAQTSFYTDEELLQIGFKSIGKGCCISRKASFYGVSSIIIGDNVRIDDFCILSGNITLGSNIHISAYVAMYGAEGIVMEDYTGISPRSTVYSAMDDFSGDYLVGPVNPEGTTHVVGGQVIIKQFAHVGTHSVVFPNLTIEEGCVIGSCSLLRHSTEPWGIYYGIPAKRMKERKMNMLRFVNGGGVNPRYNQQVTNRSIVLPNYKEAA